MTTHDIRYLGTDIDAKSGEELDRFVRFFGFNRQADETDEQLRARFKRVCLES